MYINVTIGYCKGGSPHARCRRQDRCGDTVRGRQETNRFAANMQLQLRICTTNQ